MPGLPPPLVLREPGDGDQAFIRTLYASTRDDLRLLPLPAAALENLVAMQQRAHEEGRRAAYPQARVLIMEAGGMPCGRVVLDIGGHAWRLLDIALLPEMRSRGLARQVLAAIQAQAAPRRASIGLAVQRSNAAALGLYRRCGFAIVGGDSLHHEMLWPAPDITS